MKNFISKHSTEADYNGAQGTFDKPHVAMIQELLGIGDAIRYMEKSISHDYSQDYLTIISKSDNNTIGWKASNSSNLKTISISTDTGQTWTDRTSSTSGTTLATLNNGDKLLIKGSNTTYATGNSDYYNYFTSTKIFDVEGNIMSLLYGDNFIGQTSLSEKDYTFKSLFRNNSYVVNAENLILPATTLAEGCYSWMFYSCTSLITTPELPATTLTELCYSHMFSGCTSLTTAPELPATTLAGSCYNGMFYGCHLLTTAPELPATTLARQCYQDMFDGCRSLTMAPALSATTLASSCYQSMFIGCTSLITAPELPATTLASSCYYQMFQGCTSLTTAPSLPAITLTDSCYKYMFYGCTSLNYIKCLATNISASNCTTNWVYNVAVIGTFMKEDSMDSWTNEANGIPAGWTIVNKYEAEYLTIVSKANNNTIKLQANNVNIQKTISVSTDGGQTWTNKESSIEGTPLATLNNGDKLLIKGSNTAYATSNYYNYFTSTQNFDVSGNIMSLLYADNFIGETSLSGKNYVFYRLFNGNNYVVDAQNLKLPATTLAQNCYTQIFQGCTSLTTAPVLPAITLSQYCYQEMFYGCTSLTTAPTLPATTLEYSCYYGMFSNCTSLTTAPELPATILINNCYYQMFSSCTSLNYIKCLATDISASNCTTNWVQNVASIGTFTKDPSMTSWTTDDNGIPTGWTIEDYHNYSNEYLTIASTADNNTIGWKAYSSSLLKTISVSKDGGQTWEDKKSSTSGTTLATLNNGDKLLIKGSNTVYATNDYYNYFTSTQNFDVSGNIMSLLYGDNFIGQTSLSGKSYAFRYLFKNNTYLVNAENLILPATTLASSCYYQMFYYCRSLTTAPELPATTLAYNCYGYMFDGCTSLATAPEILPATTLASSCYSSMFYSCKALITAPELPATTLVGACYAYMFNGCTLLNYIKCLATNISASDCTTMWVSNVAASGTFVKNSSMTSWTIGNKGIPSGWTVEDATT